MARGLRGHGYSQANVSGSLQGILAFLGNVATCWLSHAVVGACSFSAVFTHLLLLIKLADENSTDFIRRYERRLQTKLLAEFRAYSRPPDISTALEVLDDDIVAKLIRDDFQRRPREAPFRGKGRPEDRRERTPRRSPRRDTKQRATREASSEKDRAPRDRPTDDRQPRDPGAARRPPICFDHDPASGKRCANFRTCKATREHLDTSKADEKARYDKAKAAFERRRGAR